LGKEREKSWVQVAEGRRRVGKEKDWGRDKRKGIQEKAKKERLRI